MTTCTWAESNPNSLKTPFFTLDGHLVLLDGTYLRGILHLVPLHRDDLLALVLAEPDQPGIVAVLSERVLSLSAAELSVVESGRRSRRQYYFIRVSD